MTLGFVIPAKAGIQSSQSGPSDKAWIPAFAGMTNKILYVQPFALLNDV